MCACMCVRLGTIHVLNMLRKLSILPINYEPIPLFLIFLFYVNSYFTHTCVCAPCACLMTSNPLELEIQTVVSKSSGKAVSTAAHWAISPALLFTFHMCSCFCTCFCMWRSEAFLFFQGLSLISPIWLNWQACLCLPSTRIPCICHHTWLFKISLMGCKLIYSHLQGKQHFTS